MVLLASLDWQVYFGFLPAESLTFPALPLPMNPLLKIPCNRVWHCLEAASFSVLAVPAGTIVAPAEQVSTLLDKTIHTSFANTSCFQLPKSLDVFPAMQWSVWTVLRNRPWLASTVRLLQARNLGFHVCVPLTAFMGLSPPKILNFTTRSW